MVTNEDPAVFLAVDLTQGPVLTRNPELIDRRVEMLKGARLLVVKRRMPRILKKLSVGHPGKPSNRFWQRPVLLPERDSPDRAERHLELLRRHLDHPSCLDVVKRLLQDSLEGLRGINGALIGQEDIKGMQALAKVCLTFREIPMTFQLCS